MGRGMAAGIRRVKAVVTAGFGVMGACTAVEVGRIGTWEDRDLNWGGFLIIRLLEDESWPFRRVLWLG